MQQSKLLVCALLVGTSCTAAATQVDYALSVGTALAIESISEVQKAQLFARPHVQAQGDGWSAEFKGTATFNVNDRLLPNGPEVQGYSTLSRPLRLGDDGFIDVTELWLHQQLTDHLGVKAGKQVLNWGTLDELRVLDVINPQQFREFVFEDLGRTKLGLWGVTLDTKLGQQLVNLFVSHDQTVHESPGPNNLFQFKAPELRFGFPVGVGNGVNTLQRKPERSTYALRIKGQHAALDYSAVLYSGPDYNPVGTLQFTPGQPLPTLVRNYAKRDLLGFGAGTAWGSSVARMEYAYSPNRSINTLQLGGRLPNLAVAEIDQQQLALGLDQQMAGNLLLTAQWLVDQLAQRPAGLVRQHTAHLTTLGFRKPLMNERLALKGRWVFADSGSDGLVQLTGDYALTDQQNLRLGVDMAHGRPDQLFGQFVDRSRLKVEYERHLY